MKPIFRLVFFAALFSIAELSSAEGAATVWWESGMVKLRQANSGSLGDPIPADADFCTASGCVKGGVVLSAARNEFEPFQVVVAAPASSGLTGVDLKISDLKDSAGNVIVAQDAAGKPKSIVMYREHYLSIGSTTLSSAEGKAGLWPDGLVPKVDEYFGEVRRMPGESAPAFPFNVAADKKQGIWFDVYVPTGTQAGSYTGSIQVTMGGATIAQIPVTLTVYDFELPSTPSLKSAYALGVGEAAMGHYGTKSVSDPQFWEIICLYTKEMLLHRVSNSDVVWPKPRWSAMLGKIDWSLPPISTTCNQRYPEFLTGGDPALLPNGKLPGAKITRARLRDGLTNTAETETLSYYQDIIRHFSEMGWKDRLFYALWEEPAWPLSGGVRRCDLTWSGTASTAWRDLYQKSKFFKDNGLDLPMMSTTSRQAAEDCFTRYLKVPDYTRYLDFWTVPNRYLDGKPDAQFPFNANLRGTYDPVITTGKELWWYHGCGNHGCGGSETDFATPMVDLPSIYSRVYQWLTYRYQIGYRAPGPETILYFEMVYAYQFATNDPWKNIYYFSGNGDGTYFYPGRPDKIGGTTHIPISSIRMKMLREGIEDYEYLVQLEAKKDNEGLDGKSWIKEKILDPYLAAKDPNDGLNKFITYVWNRNPGSATSATGLLRARQEMAAILSAIPDFSLSASPASANVTAGGGTTAAVTVLSLNGFHSAVGLTCAASDPAITCRISPASVTPSVNGSAQAALNITALSSAKGGGDTLSIDGISGGLRHRTTLSLTVQTGVTGDAFNRASGTAMGSGWNEYLLDFEIFNQELRNKDSGSQEAQWTQALGASQDVSVNCKVAASGNSCGVMARWSDPNNFYYALIDPGLGSVILFKKVNGVYTKLSSANRTMKYNTYYPIRLVVKGTILQLFFNGEGTAAVTLTDSSLSGSYAGIRSYAAAVNTTYFDNFSAGIP